mmetsp:Transcript_97334/g.231582  ORF Transcript_97334/g.231582 Transcript_97334/m.231582 type:complete len:209 (-) Transcript_97334:19-645(-)
MCCPQKSFVYAKDRRSKGASVDSRHPDLTDLALVSSGAEVPLLLLSLSFFSGAAVSSTSSSSSSSSSLSASSFFSFCFLDFTSSASGFDFGAGSVLPSALLSGLFSAVFSTLLSAPLSLCSLTAGSLVALAASSLSTFSSASLTSCSAIRSSAIKLSSDSTASGVLATCTRLWPCLRWCFRRPSVPATRSTSSSRKSKGAMAPAGALR